MFMISKVRELTKRDFFNNLKHLRTFLLHLIMFPIPSFHFILCVPSESDI